MMIGHENLLEINNSLLQSKMIVSSRSAVCRTEFAGLGHEKLRGFDSTVPSLLSPLHIVSSEERLAFLSRHVWFFIPTEKFAIPGFNVYICPLRRSTWHWAPCLNVASARGNHIAFRLAIDTINDSRARLQLS